MAYKRKTVNVWEVQQYTGRECGRECVCAEERFRDARARVREYRENQPEYPVRIKMVREPITPEVR